jgi:multicomponent Na+:H+ antiporter subunit E
VSSLVTLPRRLPHIVVFLAVFMLELVKANLRVAWEVVTPGLKLQPAIVRVPTDCTSEWEMLWLANTLTMTPGTLAVEVDTQTRDLYVHTLYFEDREAFVSEVRDLERTLLRALR